MVFVSHSNAQADKKMVSECKKAMESCGLTGYFAEEDIQASGILWNKIANKIKNADAILVLWTNSASESGDVREEIGIAIGYDKKDKIVPIVQNGIEPKG